MISEPPPVPSVAALAGGGAPGSIRSINGIPPERLEIARCIGLWLKRSLADQHRGQSGREKINLQSRVYLVARDINRVCFNPPKVFFTWCEAKPLCKSSLGPGDAVFIGLPSKTEAVTVPRHAFVQDDLVHGSNGQMTENGYTQPYDREVP